MYAACPCSLTGLPAFVLGCAAPPAVLSQYIYDQFNTSLTTAGALASLFGFCNIFSRPAGGLVSDLAARRCAVQGCTARQCSLECLLGRCAGYATWSHSLASSQPSCLGRISLPPKPLNALPAQSPIICCARPPACRRRRFGMRGRLWVLYLLQSSAAAFCCGLSRFGGSLGGTMAMAVCMALAVTAASGGRNAACWGRTCPGGGIKCVVLPASCPAGEAGGCCRAGM